MQLCRRILRILNLSCVESFGTNSVKVYHNNQEYAQLYENFNQESRDLNEPASNIQHALGVFSAFNGQEIFFEVVYR